MKDLRNYLLNFDAASSGYPYGKFRDDPGDESGSEETVLTINDFYYGMVAPIEKYLGGITNTDETTLASDFLNAMETAIGVVVNQDITGSIDLALYISDITVICNPTADITITFTNELPEGKRLRIWNVAATWKVTPTIEGDTYDLYEDANRKYISDGTNMVLASYLISDSANTLTVTADCTIDQDLAIAADVQHNQIRIESDFWSNAALQIHNTTATHAGIRFTNLATGPYPNNGSFAGLDPSGKFSIVQTENNSVSVFTNGLERLIITGDGKLSTGAEIAPDVDPGGLCLNQKQNDNFIMTLKGTGDVNHGITTVAETDTYGIIEKVGTLGGAYITGITSSPTSLSLRAIGVGDGSPANTNMRFEFYKKNGTGIAPMDATHVMLAMYNASNLRWFMEGSGEVFNDYATTMTLFDSENDIELGRALQQKIGGIKISKNMTNKLQKLGIINKKGFASQQTLTALQLGISSQLSNIVRHFAKHIGITENQLLEWSKDYS